MESAKRKGYTTMQRLKMTAAQEWCTRKGIRRYK